MDESLKAPLTWTACAIQKAALILDRLTATNAMFIGRSKLLFAQIFVPSGPVPLHL